jgi:predicted nucleic acid-binding protein
MTTEGEGRALPCAVLDSNVIYSRVLHELMGRLAAASRFLTVIWSEELLAESLRVIRDNKPTSQEAAERWVDLVRRAFPDGEVDLSSVPAATDLSQFTADPDDEHVCALAIAGRADYLFTFDKGFRRDALAEKGIALLPLDAYLTNLIDDEPEAVIQVIEAQANAWGGGKPVSELLDAYERAHVPVFAERARKLLS